MRLTFSTSDYLNTSMADEHGRSLYTVSTSGFLNRQTTLYKANTSGSSNDPTTLATIKWSHCSSDKIWFEGREVEASQLMTQHGCCSSPCFVGPDDQTYKWKIGSENCWLKRESMDGQLAKYHKHNLGIRKPSHPPYLDISDSLQHILDHVVLTFILAENMSRSYTLDLVLVFFCCIANLGW